MALAAGISIAAWIAPQTEPPMSPRVIAEMEPVAQAVSTPLVERPVAPVASRAPRRRVEPKPVFLSLDDEPIETGVVVRVELGEARIPADVVFGADGKAHAIRLVNSSFK